MRTTAGAHRKGSGRRAVDRRAAADFIDLIDGATRIPDGAAMRVRTRAEARLMTHPQRGRTPADECTHKEPLIPVMNRPDRTGCSRALRWNGDAPRPVLVLVLLARRAPTRQKRCGEEELRRLIPLGMLRFNGNGGPRRRRGRARRRARRRGACKALATVTQRQASRAYWAPPRPSACAAEGGTAGSMSVVTRSPQFLQLTHEQRTFGWR